MVQQINEQESEAYFERLGPLVETGTVLFMIGGSACCAHALRHAAILKG